VVRAPRTVPAMTPPRDWDAGAYDRVATPMTQRGTELVDELDLRGDETVIDAGCGTGQVTARLLERLPDGHVIALDGSRAMLDLAAERFGDDDRVCLMHADLAQPLTVRRTIDAVVSTSTLHWVTDHDALWRNLRGVLRPGGVLRAEFGGAGNIAGVLEHVRALGVTHDPWCFATPQETERRLHDAGFEQITTRLVPRSAVLEPGELVEYLRAVVLGGHVEHLGPEAGERLVRDVAARMPAPEIDYVRLQVAATA
jgi:trans-aconitate 2-methyltransferase